MLSLLTNLVTETELRASDSESEMFPEIDISKKKDDIPIQKNIICVNQKHVRVPHMCLKKIVFFQGNLSRHFSDIKLW